MNVLDKREMSEEIKIKLVMVKEFLDNRLTYKNLKDNEDLNEVRRR